MPLTRSNPYIESFPRPGGVRPHAQHGATCRLHRISATAFHRSFAAAGRRVWTAVRAATRVLRFRSAAMGHRI